MEESNLIDFFTTYLEKEPLFKDKSVLQSNFTPETIPHREEQIKTIANILAPALKLEKPSNLFIYGKTGTGKTVTIKFVAKNMEKIAKERNIPLKIIYLNCKLKKVADTEYRLAARIIKEFGHEIPATGLPTDEVYKTLFELIDEKKQLVLLILDEIDQLVKKSGDEVLYNLTRINAELKNSQISIIGISNDLIFIDHIDPRVKSRLSEEEIIFPPYNAIQLQSILLQRAEKAFKPNVLEEGVIEKCAAYAAREHGDARRALELLRVAGEIAERQNDSKIRIEHIDQAEEKIEKDRILDIVKTQPKQHQATLLAILNIFNQTNSRPVFTGEVYELYKQICLKASLRPLTQRRISDIISELDMLGIISAKVISKGRYGRTREIASAISKTTQPKIKAILEEALNLK
ncbi:MAG TPA: ORC1-type DNA replication protein [Candidatus Woesearchaeota archaeon]|nr:ORC1-type DNA replication protein [Candidatus Woesearchaeota archaeon]